MSSSLLYLIFLLLSSPILNANFTGSLLQGFENPSAQYRPKFRYWLPDASVPSGVLRQDIASIASVGGGGLEFLPFYLYGDVVGAATPPTDWNTYGFGTPAFRDLFQVALEAAKDNKLLFDFAVGANQGQGVPSAPGTPGLAMELRYGHDTIMGGEHFNGTIPKAADFWFLSGFMGELEPFGEDKLVAVLAGQIISRDVVNFTIAAGSYSAFPILETVLKESSIIDLTSEVTNGFLGWTPPTDSNYTLIAFYERYTNQRSCIGGVNATDFIGNGSWTVDHFSAAGSKRTTDFLDQHVIYDEVKDLLEEVGEYSWEDSMEQQAALFWTPGFLQRFEAARGYSAIPYLPLFFDVSNQWGQELPAYNETWVYGEYNQDGKSVHLGDYQTTLNEGYQEYLQHFTEWATSIGVKHSCQPAYNLPLNMLADVPVPDIPELESLGFKDDIDLYRQFVGPAQLQQRNIISSEVGAVMSGSYFQTVPALLRLFKTSFAAGVNMMVIHGFSYTGEYPGTTWPGYATFGYLFTEQWDDKQPAWRHLKDSLDYTARCQMVLQTGVPRVDLAFYLFEDPWLAKDAYLSDNLNALGYTYEYLTADNLLSPEAHVESGILAPNGPAYKALIFSNQTQISPDAVEKLQEFALNGLPILFIGGLPTNGIGTDGNLSSISKSLTSLLATYSQVQILSDSSLIPAHLHSLGLNPRASYGNAVSGVYTQWRSDVSTGLEMMFIFNQGPDQLVTFNFDEGINSTPYFLNAWTGNITSLVMYNVTEAYISTTIDLKANQTKIIAFQSSSDRPTHVISTTGDISGFSINEEAGIYVLASGPGIVNLSDGQEMSIDAQPIPSINIGNWSLVMLSYHPSSNVSSTANEISTIDVGTLDILKSWIEIPGLEQVSGIGIYTSSFNFPHSTSEVAAIISFGPILNTIRVWVNDQLLSPVDLADSRADVTQYVGQGLNTIRVEVSSTLFNAVKARVNSTMTAYIPLALTNAPFYEDNDYMPFGLLGPVVVTLMTRIKLPA
ncbi:uncharacterized protein PAC_13439 [Phialocephala subalpina]|uniref:Secreted protein n=1 Tax=Phialocephala subalpina TaxID=576137 RepID=A0A1L7XET3_9HELO|nr:uncharacterized protein PAC_13439 [Phialocephala subalpina]